MQIVGSRPAQTCCFFLVCLFSFLKMMFYSSVIILTSSCQHFRKSCVVSPPVEKITLQPPLFTAEGVKKQFGSLGSMHHAGQTTPNNRSAFSLVIRKTCSGVIPRTWAIFSAV